MEELRLVHPLRADQAVVAALVVAWQRARVVASMNSASTLWFSEVTASSGSVVFDFDAGNMR